MNRKHFIFHSLSIMPNGSIEVLYVDLVEPHATIFSIVFNLPNTFPLLRLFYLTGRFREYSPVLRMFIAVMNIKYMN